MEVMLVLALGPLVYTFVIFVKNLTAQQWKPAITQAIAWLAGIGAVLMMAAAQFAGGISIGNTTLDKLDFWPKVLVGVLVASVVSMLHEFKKAIDRTDTAVVPDWFEPKAEATKRTHMVLPESIATPEAIEQARLTVASSHTTPSSS